MFSSIFSFSGGDGSQENPMQIRTIAEMYEMIGYQNIEHAHWHYKLMQDIDFGNLYWDQTAELYGTFDGNGHTLRNFRINEFNSENNGTILFINIMEDAILKNLNIILHNDGFIVNLNTADNEFSIIAYNNYGLIDNCSVTGDIYAGKGNFGAIAYNNYASINQCSVYLNILTGGNYIGGICALNNINKTISNCYSEINYSSGFDYIGGICAFNDRGILMNNSALCNLTFHTYGGAIVGKSSGNIIGCSASGTINGLRFIGGIAGYVFASYMFDVLIEDCYSSCNVNAIGENSTLAGGLIGMLIKSNNSENYVTVNSCYSSGNITEPIEEKTGDTGAGGLIGRCDYGAYITNSYATGNVTAHRGGGLIGIFIGNMNTVSYIRNCYATGNVECDISAGGFIDLLNYAIIENCYAKGNVKIHSVPNQYYKPGGFIATNYQGKVKFCYSIGTVKYMNTNNVVNCAFVGIAETGGLYEMYRNYYDKETADNNTQLYEGYVATGKTTSEMKNQSTYLNWDFSNRWRIFESINNGYPYLINAGIATLPVILSSFNAISINNSSVNIIWTTQSEVNTLGYHLYRNNSNNLSSSVRITNTLISAYNNSYEQNYAFFDDSVEAGSLYFYWLHSIDYNGSSLYYGPIYINIPIESPELPEIALNDCLNPPYPNPFNPYISISYSIQNPSTPIIEIFNVKGQLIKMLINSPHLSGNYTTIWDGTDLNHKGCASGIYFCKMSINNKYFIKKISLIK